MNDRAVPYRAGCVLPILDWSRRNLCDEDLSDGGLLAAEFSKLAPRTVWLHGNFLTAASAPQLGKLLSRAPADAMVTRLNLTDNNFGDAGVEALLAALSPQAASSLTSLSLAVNGLGSRTAATLARAMGQGPLTSLRELRVSGNDINDAARAQLTKRAATRAANGGGTFRGQSGSGESTPADAPDTALAIKSLLVTATLRVAHEMSVLMPPTADEFVDVLKGGERPCFTGANEPGLTCTGAQFELLGGLIDDFNTATTAQARFARVCRFMVEAGAAEKAAGAQTLAGGSPQTVEDYKMVCGASPETVYLLEDYPEGNEAHAMTLAVGVFRWARFNANLVDAKVQSFASVEERNAAARELGILTTQLGVED